MAFRKHAVLSLFLAALAAMSAIPSDAKAAITINGPVNCNVTQVGWRNDTKQLLIVCGGTNFWTPEASANAGCGLTLSMDVIKMYQSIATSSDLSGKQVQIWWGTNTGTGCAGLQSIRDFYLLN
jgi:hypothetical protein